MARENFLWGAPRIHGELLMLGFAVSQATVSRYMPKQGGRRGQSWRTFLGNQAMAFARIDFEELSRGDASPHVDSGWAMLMRTAATKIATSGALFGHVLGIRQPTQSAQRIRLPSVQHDHGLRYRAASRSAALSGALCNRSRVAFLIRSPPR